MPDPRFCHSPFTATALAWLDNLIDTALRREQQLQHQHQHYDVVDDNNNNNSDDDDDECCCSIDARRRKKSDGMIKVLMISTITDEENDDNNENDDKELLVPTTKMIKKKQKQQQRRSLVVPNLRNRIIAKVLIRHLVYNCLRKYSTISSRSDVEEALKYHILPPTLQVELAAKYNIDTISTKESHKNRSSVPGGHEAANKLLSSSPPRPPSPPPPKTWFEAIEQLQVYCQYLHQTTRSCDDEKYDSDTEYKLVLWEHILDHPITAYVPVQCQSCGQSIPDVYNTAATAADADAAVGLSEVAPTPEEVPYVRPGGWFRGPRTARPTVFQLECTHCGTTSRWYRSRHPRSMLNPHKWGRLCGEQEDWKLDLGRYLQIIQPRTILPLDWDHVWSEYRSTDSSSSADPAEATNNAPASIPKRWNLSRHDDNERNFVVRLDEGIGAFTRIFAICPTSKESGDVTDSYLTPTTQEGCANHDEKYDDKNTHNRSSTTGRVDPRFANDLSRYQARITTARMDPTGATTQSKTVNGYAIQRANFTTDEITNEIQLAVRDYYGHTNSSSSSCNNIYTATTTWNRPQQQRQREWYDIII